MISARDALESTLARPKPSMRSAHNALTALYESCGAKPPRDALLVRDLIARTLAEYEGLEIGWQCYLASADTLLSALKNEGFAVTKANR